MDQPDPMIRRAVSLRRHDPVQVVRVCSQAARPPLTATNSYAITGRFVKRTHRHPDLAESPAWRIVVAMTQPPATSPEANPSGWRLRHTYRTLPPVLFRDAAPTPVRAPDPLLVNHPLAKELGLDPAALATPDTAPILTGNHLPPGAAPLAQAYAGHQFGHFTMLGDGRAILIGEQEIPDGRLVDIQYKGVGPTDFARRGDGRAALGPMLREYIISEAMAALGIPTTRALSVAATGEPVFRETPLPGAVLIRTAASHLRVGTFEFAAACGQPDALSALADYTIRRHAPACAHTAHPHAALLEHIVQQQASLIAAWMQVGFIHGVMNTDNMAVSGETIDYGPCAFMDTYDPATVFSSIDHQGRYAFANQPRIAAWNLARLAEAMLPLLDPDPDKAIARAQPIVSGFSRHFEAAWHAILKRKLGWIGDETQDGERAEEWLTLLHREHLDYTNAFRRLIAAEPPGDHPDLRRWHRHWLARIHRQPGGLEAAIALMRAANPAVIPRNHLVEQALQAATRGDLQPVHDLLAALRYPYDHTIDRDRYQQPPRPDERVHATFCGT